MSLEALLTGILARGDQPGLAHKAVLEVTGWPNWLSSHECRIANLILQPLPEKWQGQRVTVRIYPRTQLDGPLRLPLEIASVRAAQQANEMTFEVVGRLMQLDRGTSRIRVRVYPGLSKTKPFEMMMWGTGGCLRQADSDWTGVRVTGSVINRQLIAEVIEPVYAPLAPHRHSQLVKDKRAALLRRKKRTERLRATERDWTDGAESAEPVV